MAKKSKQKKKLTLTKPLIIIIILLIIAGASFFGVSYFLTSKDLKSCSAKVVDITADGKNITATINVSGSADSFDVFLEDSKNKIYLSENDTNFNKDITYTKAVSYNTEYSLGITIKEKLKFVKVLELVNDFDSKTKIKTEEAPAGADGVTENIVYDNFQIHFLELGNKSAGDSIYIKAGENDILIDAGSEKGSATVIKEYVDQYCTDGKLEYVIATHAHEDHIAGFVGKVDKDSRTGIFYTYDIENLIDFALTDATSILYNTEYVNAIEYVESKGTTHHKVDWYFDSSRNPKEEASISLGDNISMDILYNKYYFESSKDENNYSVCTMFNYLDHHFIFTGDLELDGEEALAAYYSSETPEKTLPHVDLFKAGHHGSKTSSNDVLLEKITPNICVACCCAGYTEYSVENDVIFPTQDFINQIARYTSRVYVTSLFDRNTKDFTSMNGCIIVSCNGTSIGLSATNNLIKLKDTEWFNEDIYIVDGKVASGSKKSTNFYDETSSDAVKIKQRVWPDYGVA